MIYPGSEIQNRSNEYPFLKKENKKLREEIERLRDALFAVAARDLQSLAQGALEGSEEDRIAALKIIALYDMQKIAIQALEKTK